MTRNLETAIYIDYDNLYRSINESYSAFTGSETVRKIINHFDEKSEYNVKLVKAFCDFKNSYQEIEDLQNNLVELRHINSVGNGKSNASDIGLAIDVVKSLFNNKKFDNYVIVSSDSDMLPLILELNYQGKEVTLVYLESKTSDKYTGMLVQRPDIKTLKIEEILGIKVHEPIREANLESDLILVTKYLNFINEITNDLFDKFSDGTTVSQNIIKEGLKSKDDSLEDLDVTIILDFMKNKGYINRFIKDVNIKGKKEQRNSYLLDIEKIKGENITLDTESKIIYPE